MSQQAAAGILARRYRALIFDIYIYSLFNQCTISAVSKDGRESLWTAGHDLSLCAKDRDVFE